MSHRAAIASQLRTCMIKTVISTRTDRHKFHVASPQCYYNTILLICVTQRHLTGVPFCIGVAGL
ncbi:hypothetical protein PGT21_035116 [Puccinia graminis f. sp. tritici]|uniref:Uncharacterized protein n=1 Tax=Puccinia graminis f. sp. tritici TaxID=56615 RepID=A0A5B0MQN8_PUCGR|nr:hypothetical protein PGT21_035116 [Puccinia graminis f. sp. tritici]